MKKSIVKKLFLLIAILFIGWALFGLVSIFNKLDGLESTRIIHFDKLKIEFKIQAKTWGLAGNHEEIYVTSSESSETDSQCDTLLFYSDQLFYKAIEPDTLIIYVKYSSFSETTPKLCSKVNIKIVDLKYFDGIKQMENSFHEHGLERISIYDNK